jgi:hypothetical protein
MKKIIQIIPFLLFLLLFTACAGQFQYVPYDEIKEQPGTVLSMEDIEKLLEGSGAGARVFVALTGGGTGALDKVGVASLSDDDVAWTIVGDVLGFYQYHSAATDAENSPYYIRPDDYSTSGVWYLVNAFRILPTATPKLILRDSDATAFDDNIYLQGNCTDTGDGTEDCDLSIYVQIAGLATEVFKVDADGEFELSLSMDLASGKVYKINNVQINIGNLGAGGNWTPTGTLDFSSTTDTTYKDGTVDLADFAAGAKFTSYQVSDLSDTVTPSVLTTAETTNSVISNYKSSGADHVFTMPACHAAGNVIFPIGDEFQVDVEPNTSDLFYLNGTAMAANEHIQNTADTLGDRMVGYCVNINGTLRWMFYGDSNWVEETP